MDNARKLTEKRNVGNTIKLMQKAHSAIVDVGKDRNNKTIGAAKETLSELKGFQDQYKKVKWSTVRIINSTDLLILENILQSLLSRTDIAASYTYDATRNFVEEYNPSYGTGLIPEPIPKLEKIVCFWKKYQEQ